VTSLPAWAIAGRVVLRNTSGKVPSHGVADRGDGALISSSPSKAGQRAAIMSARSQSGARSAPSTARRGGPKVLWRPGSASRRVRPDHLVLCRQLVARIAEALQNAVVRTDCLPERQAAVVGDAMLGGQALDDRAQLPVVNVADPREQMVLDLIIQAADVPGQQPVAGAKLLVVRI
jgi:hypothetical protein